MCHLTGHYAALLLLTFVAGCASEVARPHTVVEPPLVPFEQVFAVADTVRLDSTIVVGSIHYVDANPSGDLLVSDPYGAVYMFDRHGQIVRTFRPEDCLIGRRGGRMGAAQFGPAGTTIVYHGAIGMVVFDAQGRCLASDAEARDLAAACSLADTIHTIPGTSPHAREAVTYTLGLERIGVTKTLPPKFRRLGAIFSPLYGLALACFDDGPYYTTLSRPDAWPVREHTHPTQAHPRFFEERERDLSLTRDDAAETRQIVSAPINGGVFALEPETRMVIYLYLQGKWRSVPHDRPIGIGLGIASNTNKFTPVSTLSQVYPLGARDGYIYSAGDNEQLPNGDMGNPVVLRHRFIPPTDATP
ncbi:MAG: hypothetical protein OXI38_12820 [Bacteroidota bacterium]|nr:hypothetical protein [Bacteroidota bacterium]